MLVVGLTGGVGMGKSRVAEYLAGRGDNIIDTDVIARELVEPGSAALEEIKAHFGAAVIKEGGALDRTALAQKVFESEQQRQVLEGILHPRIRARWKRMIDRWRAEGKRRAIVVIPLLFETGAALEVQRTVCVACSQGVQIARLLVRGWTAEEAQKRNAAQWPIARKMELADAVIWNESTIALCEMQAARVFA
jgi:dephospho-CoA kinase